MTQRPGAATARPAAGSTRQAVRMASQLSRLASTAAAGLLQDVTVIADVARVSCTGIDALQRRRLEQLRQGLGEWRSVIALMRHLGLLESLAGLHRLGWGTAAMTLASTRELTAMTVDLQREALDPILHRIGQDIDDIQRP